MADNDEEVLPPLSLSNDEFVFLLLLWPFAAKSSVSTTSVTVAFFSLSKLNMDLIAAEFVLAPEDIALPDMNGCLK